MTVYCYYKSSFIDEFYDEVLAQPVAHIQHLHRGILCGIMLCRHSMASSMTSAWNHFNYLPTSWMSWISVWLIFWLSLIAFMKISTGYSHVYFSSSRQLWYADLPWSIVVPIDIFHECDGDVNRVNSFSLVTGSSTKGELELLEKDIFLHHHLVGEAFGRDNFTPNFHKVLHIVDYIREHGTYYDISVCSSLQPCNRL